MELVRQAAPEQKKVLGKPANVAKGKLTAAFGARQQEVQQGGSASRESIDVTEPGLQPAIGNRHILMKVIDELVELFGRMGFSVATGPEVEDDFHNFVALNIPESHPARDPLDYFYLASDEATKRRSGDGEDAEASPPDPSSLRRSVAPSLCK